MIGMIEEMDRECSIRAGMDSPARAPRLRSAASYPRRAAVSASVAAWPVSVNARDFHDIAFAFPHVLRTGRWLQDRESQLWCAH
jgi:hypothetical protein